MSYRDDEDSRRAQRLLSRIQIASPCPASWDAMAGDERSRMCGLCDERVHDLSQLTALEGLRLITEAEGSACVRLYRRADGKVQTADCRMGPRRKRHRRLRVLGATAAIAVLSGATALTAASWPESAPMFPDSETPPLPDVLISHGRASPAPDEIFDADTFLHGHPGPERDPYATVDVAVFPDDGALRDLIDACAHADCITNVLPDVDLDDD